MSYGPDNIHVLTAEEAIQKRPGMYLGDVSALGVARLIGMAVDVLAALVANRETGPTFAYHAFLDVTLSDREANVLIDYHPNECTDFSVRCESLAANRHRMRPDQYALEQGQNAVAPIAILDALTTNLSIFSSSGDNVKIVLETGISEAPSKPSPIKGALIGARFRIREIIDTSDVHQDYLEGFLQGGRKVPGLIVRNVALEPPG